MTLQELLALMLDPKDVEETCLSRSLIRAINKNHRTTLIAVKAGVATALGVVIRHGLPTDFNSDQLTEE